MDVDIIPNAGVPDFDVIRPPDADLMVSPAAGESSGDDGFSFWDFLDIINPLQHIPILSSVYRAITHDDLAPGPRLLGGSLFGGPIGFAVALANIIVEDASGKDVGTYLFAVVTDLEPGGAAPLPRVAEARPFGRGAASGSGAPTAAAPVAGAVSDSLLGSAATARNELFVPRLAAPAPAREESRDDRDERSGGEADAAFDGTPPRRAEDLSAQELVKILAGFQGAIPVSPTPSAGQGSPMTPPRPGLLPIPPLF